MDRIGLIGAPGAGKTRLAHLLAEKLRTEDEPYKVIDNYVEPLADEIGVALGHFATFLGNTLIAGERVKRELHFQGVKKVNTITCGTALETTTYMSTAVGVAKERNPRNEYILERSNVAIATFGLILHDTFRYDHLFFLPLEPSEEREAVFDQHLNQELEAAIKLFNVPAITLEGDDDARLEKALQEIASAREAAEDRTESTTPDE